MKLNVRHRLLLLAGRLGRAHEDFSQVVGYVTEIAQASTEQATGIQPIAEATRQVDREIQQNAADSEEGASASEEAGRAVGDPRGSRSAA
ncbi:MAG: hypothetical protein ACLFU2_06140 [Opitutales bacterium]